VPQKRKKTHVKSEKQWKWAMGNLPAKQKEKWRKERREGIIKIRK